MNELDPGSSGVRPWLRDSGLLMAFQLAATAVGTITFLLIARSLGRHDFGAFAAVLGVAGAASIFLDAGLGTFLLRELSRKQIADGQVDDDLIATALWIEVRMVTVAAPFAAFVSLLLTHKLSLALLAGILVGYVGLLALATSIEAGYRAQRRVGRVGMASFVEKLSALIAIVLLVVAGRHDIVLVGCVLLCSAGVHLGFDILALPSAELLRRKAPSSIRDDVRLLRRTIPFVATSAILVVIPRLAVTALAIVSATVAADFALGDRLAISVVVYSASLSETLYPHIARGALRAGRAFAIQFGAGAFGCLVIAILARPVLDVAFGAAHSVSVDTVRIMALSIPFTFLASGYLVHAYSRGLESRTSVFSLAATVIGTVVIVAGAVAWGSTGAAVGYVLRQMLFCGSLGLLLYRANIVKSTPTENALSPFSGDSLVERSDAFDPRQGVVR